MKKNLLLCLTLAIFFFCLNCEELATESSEDPLEDMDIPTVSTGTLYVENGKLMCGGLVEYDGGGDIIEKGICWSDNDAQPDIESSNHIKDFGDDFNFECKLPTLEEGTTYHLRAFASNPKGTSYGETKTYTQPEFGTVTDIDGNIYKTVKIGDQWWMAENLKVTRYQNGDTIPTLFDKGHWKWADSGATCYYDNDYRNLDRYGRLYNWHAVNDHRSIAPEGWHVPRDGEWQILASMLGGEETAGGYLKEAGLMDWLEPNRDATNLTGFSGLPGGGRDPYGKFEAIGKGGYFWTTTINNATSGIRWRLYHTSEKIERANKVNEMGYSVRCVKN